jgi:hypothetical protein
MARKSTLKPVTPPTPIVNFDFEERTYQIDADRRKVYRKFVEIETAKASTILSIWRAQAANA